MRKPAYERKHMVYAEDIIQELMNHPNNMIYKYELKQIIEKVAEAREIVINTCMPTSCGWSDIDNDGDIYD